jgi:hypothetical protein
LRELAGAQKPGPQSDPEGTAFRERGQIPREPIYSRNISHWVTTARIESS